MWLLFLFACDEYGLASGTVDTGAPVSDETTDNCDGDLCIDEITRL